MEIIVVILAVLIAGGSLFLAIRANQDIRAIDRSMKRVNESERVSANGETRDRIHTHETLRNLYRLDYVIDGTIEVYEPSGRRLVIVNNRQSALEYIARHHA